VGSWEATDLSNHIIVAPYHTKEPPRSWGGSAFTTAEANSHYFTTVTSPALTTTLPKVEPPDTATL
jgi:hypothetical protein